MNKWHTQNKISITTIILIISLLLPAIVYCGYISEHHHAPFGIYKNHSDQFYRALNEDNQKNKIYSNQKSDEYLMPIAESSRFEEESNLQILKQHEEIIQLLKDIKIANKK